jgi:hypothetical protein
MAKGRVLDATTAAAFEKTTLLDVCLVEVPGSIAPNGKSISVRWDGVGPLHI